MNLRFEGWRVAVVLQDVREVELLAALRPNKHIFQRYQRGPSGFNQQPLELRGLADRIELGSIAAREDEPVEVTTARTEERNLEALDPAFALKPTPELDGLLEYLETPGLASGDVLARLGARVDVPKGLAAAEAVFNQG